jgi:hypothetical protein
VIGSALLEWAERFVDVDVWETATLTLYLDERSRSEPRVEEASTGRRLSANHRTHPQDHAKEHQWQLEDEYVEPNGRMDRRLPNKVHVRLVTRGCA